MTPSPSRNLIQYGPVGGLSSGDGATVNEDGTLALKGPMKQGNTWEGIKWPCETSLFSPGSTITVSAEGLPTNSEVVLRFNDTADSANTFLFPARGENKSSGVVPSVIKSVFVAIRRTGKASDLTSNRVAVMVNSGDTALPWERPDVTDAGGGGYEIAKPSRLIRKE